MAENTIIGSNNSETIIGEATDDLIKGLGGDDTIEARDGDDDLRGGDGNDSLIGDKGDDTMQGGAGADEMEWNNGDGNDLMIGGRGRDTAEVNGSETEGDAFEISAIPRGVFFERTNLGPFNILIQETEFLEVNGLGGDDTIDASALPAGLIRLELDGGEGNDLLIGSQGNDILEGEVGDDTMEGGAGNDIMKWDDGDGSDLMDGGAGKDTAVVEGSEQQGDAFEINSVPDGVLFERTNLVPFSIDIVNTETLEVSGLGGNDTIDASGLEAGDIRLRMSGGEGNDLLIGSDGADRLVGDEGNDVMRSGLGNDLMIWNDGDGSDRMNGGRGFDIAVVNGSEEAGDAFKVTSAGDTVFFERTNFGNFTLTIVNTDKLSVNGLGGNDTLDASELQAGLIAVEARGGDGNDLLIGSQGDDLLVGDRGDDVMRGGDGNDRMVWNNGDGSDTMNGGWGDDTAEVNGSNDAGDLFKVSSAGGNVLFERVNFGNFSIDIRNTEVLEVNGLGGDDTINASDLGAGLIALKASGGDGNDYLIGSDGDDTLVGDRGDDTMRGGDGDDTMVWNNGDGSDVMNGGDGIDTAEVNGSNDAGDVFEVRSDGANVIFERTNFGNFSLDIRNTEILDLNGLGGDDTIDASALANEDVAVDASGGAGNDLLIGSESNDTLAGDAGNDTLVGFRGNDTMLGGDGDDLMVWNNGDGSDLMDGGDGIDTAQVNGSDTAGDEFVVSTNGENVFFERVNFGNFSLDIRNSEILELNGGAGDDSMDARELEAGQIALTENGGDGNDLLVGSQGDDVLAGDAGNDTLVGFRGDDTMNGGDGDDLMVWNNGDGSDLMDGGDGNDTAQVNGSDTAGDEFSVVSVGGEITFARTNFGEFTIDIDNTETLEVNGLGGDDRIDARDLGPDDIAFRAFGGEGNDQIFGGNGDDLISGGAGDDTMFGNDGADTFVYEEGADVIQDFQAGIDVVQAEGIGDAVFLQDGDDVVIDFGDGNTLTLENQLLTNLSDADFLI
ncbi:hypothetical protein DLJ53_27130 [Acuticoccus sediminis]|uniref:Hemolysin-type calcium-binding repeat-containing protein n=1 Tax=Acuticoccus sediminis TaxID=2184697 RepID=A0A8B2NL99_9HYPH|nr:calcium-binding protein [Acuticoccus sediminis]RAH98373.1 hypothetical protein DLJ53_27130 [Acuticoccus sediminis]